MPAYKRRSSGNSLRPTGSFRRDPPVAQRSRPYAGDGAVSRPLVVDA